MVQLCFNPWGWDSANSWQLLQCGPAGRRVLLEVYEVRDDLAATLGRWCARQLPGFDAAAFARACGQPGGDEPDVVVWRRSADTAAP